MARTYAGGFPASTDISTSGICGLLVDADEKIGVPAYHENRFSTQRILALAAWVGIVPAMEIRPLHTLTLALSRFAVEGTRWRGGYPAPPLPRSGRGTG